MAKKIQEEIAHRKKKKPFIPPKITPNVTPLIDVMFLLLLFFLLGTKFRVAEGAIPGTLPALGPSMGQQDNTAMPPAITVEVNPSGPANETAYYEVKGVTARIMGPEDLYKSLNDRAHGYTEHELENVPVIIKARGDARWGFVVEAFNQAARVHFKSIAFAPVGS